LAAIKAAEGDTRMKVLLHTCCAPCTTHCIEALRELGHEPTLFFSNANIYPEAEFNKRLMEVVRLAGIAGVPMIIDEQDHDQWLGSVAAGLGHEPERGERCSRCFRYALQRSCNRMVESALDAFTTTLTVSPHKCSGIIAAIGREISPERYLDINFKKKDGFKHSLTLSEQYALYRQSYCGCEFSMNAMR
jgi:epoxyqueuosine reductase